MKAVLWSYLPVCCLPACLAAEELYHSTDPFSCLSPTSLCYVTQPTRAHKLTWLSLPPTLAAHLLLLLYVATSLPGLTATPGRPPVAAAV